MAKKKEKAKEQWPPKREAVEEPAKPEQGKQELIEALLKIDGVSQEIAEHAAKHGVPDDAYVVQTFYRVTDAAAREIIKVVNG